MKVYKSLLFAFIGLAVGLVVQATPIGEPTGEPDQGVDTGPEQLIKISSYVGDAFDAPGVWYVGGCMCTRQGEIDETHSACVDRFFQSAQQQGQCRRNTNLIVAECIEKPGTQVKTNGDKQWWTDAICRRCHDAGGTADTDLKCSIGTPLKHKRDLPLFNKRAETPGKPSGPVPSKNVSETIHGDFVFTSYLSTDKLKTDWLGRCACKDSGAAGSSPPCSKAFLKEATAHGKCRWTSDISASCDEDVGTAIITNPDDRQWWRDAFCRRCTEAGGQVLEGSGCSKPATGHAKRSEIGHPGRNIHKRATGKTVFSTSLTVPDSNGGFDLYPNVGRCICDDGSPTCKTSFIKAATQHGKCDSAGPKAYTCTEQAEKPMLSGGDELWWKLAFCKRCTDAGGENDGGSCSQDFSAQPKALSESLESRHVVSKRAEGKVEIDSFIRTGGGNSVGMGSCSCDAGTPCKDNFISVASQNGQCTPATGGSYSCFENGEHPNMSHGDIQWWNRTFGKRCTDAGGINTFSGSTSLRDRSELGPGSQSIRKRHVEPKWVFETFLVGASPQDVIGKIGECTCDRQDCANSFFAYARQRGTCRDEGDGYTFACHEPGGKSNMSKGDWDWWYKAMCERCRWGDGYDPKYCGTLGPIHG